MIFGQVPYWVLGILGLAILWVNALLIALAAFKEAGRLLAIKKGLGKITHGTVVRVDNESDAFAVHEVEQVGRAIDAPTPSMIWHDRKYASEIKGGKVGDLEIEATTEGEVWPSLEKQIEVSKCPDDAALDAAYKTSKGAKGTLRTVRTSIEKGDEVWIARDGKLISAVDPAAWLSSRARASIGFALAELAVCGACTAVALRPPYFGLVSTIGGAMCLLFFVFVQPIGVGVEDANRVPSQRFLRGEWRRSAPAPELKKAKATT